MKLLAIVLMLGSLFCPLMAARKALIIGNATYTEKPLANPINDANAMSDALKAKGFSVTTALNKDYQSMRDAISSFAASLTAQDEVVFYFSGHGVQVNGKNYLLPINENPQDEDDCDAYTIKADWALGKLSIASLTVFILDACRNNPYVTKKGSGTKGLAQMQYDSSQYIIYATASGTEAIDGTGSNSPFTAALVKQIRNSPKKIEDMMKEVKTEVKKLTNNTQSPTAYGLLESDFYFTMNAPEITPQSSLKSSLPPAIEVETVWHYGNINVETDQAGDLYIDNALVQSLAQGQGAKLRVLTGFHSLELHTADDVHKQEVTLATDQTVTAKFVFGLPLQSAASKAVYQPKSRLDLVFVEGGTFAMGDSTAEAQSNEKPVHQMEIGSFYISKYEITQKQWQDVMEVNPAYFKGEYLPVERISWYDAIEFCNTLSQKEGLTPVYTLNDDKVDTNNLCAADNLKLTIIANFSADGYRLPTEAEWEFAARGGIQSSGYKYCAANDIEQAAWYDSNSEGKTHSVGRKLANELGIYDMSGSVWEWCWDWYGSDYYSNYYHHNQSKYPAGPISGEQRVLRGGSWITDAEHCRISYRYSDKPNNNIYAEYGLRPVRVVK